MARSNWACSFRSSWRRSTTAMKKGRCHATSCGGLAKRGKDSFVRTRVATWAVWHGLPASRAVVASDLWQFMDRCIRCSLPSSLSRLLHGPRADGMNDRDRIGVTPGAGCKNPKQRPELGPKSGRVEIRVSASVLHFSSVFTNLPISVTESKRTTLSNVSVANALLYVSPDLSPRTTK